MVPGKSSLAPSRSLVSAKACVVMMVLGWPRFVFGKINSCVIENEQTSRWSWQSYQALSCSPCWMVPAWLFLLMLYGAKPRLEQSIYCPWISLGHLWMDQVQPMEGE